MARALVAAEADGLPSHGLMRLPIYADQLRTGKVAGKVKPATTRATNGAYIVDAGFGFAYPATDMAVDVLSALTRSCGIAAVAITRSGHCGAMGLIVERLAEVGLIGLMMANTPGAMAPWGGQQALLGTNPVACAFPRPDAPPVVIDMSLSKVPRGKILAAKQSGEAIPPTWALDALGDPTTDPADALHGTLLPAGGAKGAMLALMVEGLAAGLTGSHYAFQASSFLDDEGGPPATGQFMIAIDPGAFGPGISHLDQLFARVAADGARLPGERRLANRQSARTRGILVQESWFAV